jgi:prefoldin subunit 2
MQGIATKIGELESDAEEHRAVIETLRETLKKSPERTCFRMIGGILVERTVKDVLPALETNMKGVCMLKCIESLQAYILTFFLSIQQLQTVIESLARQYKSKDEEMQKLQREVESQ